MTTNRPSRPLGRSELLLQVRFPDQDQAFLDTLIVEHLGSSLWRLQQTPFWSDYAAWHDVVEGAMEGNELVVRRVFDRSDCRTVRRPVPAGFVGSIVGMAFCACLVSAGGMCEAYSDGVATLNFPTESDVDWDAELRRAVEVFEGESE